MDVVKGAVSATAAAVTSPMGKTACLTGAIVACPAAGLSLLGFKASGILAGSWAASWMSSGMATGALATAQSVGAAGLSWTTYSGLTAGGLWLSQKLFK